MKRFNYTCLSAMLIILILISSAHSAGPTPYLEEQATQAFYMNGSTKTPLSGQGSLEIGVPGTTDVLQYIRINLSNDYIGKTNIISRETFSDLAASPTSGDTTPMNFDTSDGYSVSYRINDTSVLPNISMKLTYKNKDGGLDLHTGTPNTIQFNLTILPDKTISNAQGYIQIAENQFTADSMILTTASATTGTTLVRDSDSDHFADQITWSGNLVAGTPIYIIFEGRTQVGVNFASSAGYVNLYQSDATRITTSFEDTFTGIGITSDSRFARGPVRVGVRMVFRDDVWLRGTITNKAESVTYKLTDWALYNVTDIYTPISSGTVPAPQLLSPGETYETPWYIADNGSEKYYVAEFNWQTMWDPSQISRRSTSYIELPTLYQADGVAQTTLTLRLSHPIRILNITESTRSLSHSRIGLNTYNLTSIIPEGHTIENVKVYYSNETTGGSVYDITNNTSITIDSNVLYAIIENITSVITKPLATNDRIYVTYGITGASSYDRYTFRTQSTTKLNTTTGTPLILTSSSAQELPPYLDTLPPSDAGGGGFGGAASGTGTYYYSYIEQSSTTITEKSEPGQAEIESVFKIIDNGKKGVGNIRSTITLPAGSILDEDSLQVSVYDTTQKKWIVYSDDDLIIRQSPGTDDDSVIYLIDIKSSSWDEEYLDLTLMNTELYSISYTATLPYGNNKITTTLSGFDYYTDSEIEESIDSYIRINEDSTYVEGLIIKETPFQHEPIVVGKAPRWLKTIDVTNPNTVVVSHQFKTELFPEVISSHITLNNEELDHELERKEIISATFKDLLQPGDQKTYLVDVTTPPVIIEDEKYSIDKYVGDNLKFITNITLGNPSSLDYENITLYYPLDGDNVLGATYNGTELKIESESDDQIKILIPKISKKSKIIISLEYLKNPPIITTKLSNEKYSRGDLVNISVIIIPHENLTRSFIQLEVLSDDKDMNTVYAEIITVRNLEANKAHTITREFTMPETASSDFIVHTKATLSPLGEITDTTTFKVEDPIIDIKELSYLLFLPIGIFLIAILKKRIYLQREFEDEIKNIKREIDRS